MNDTLWKNGPKDILMTGIGSLPHHNVDAALAYAFRMNVPFLPQIPARNPREFMIQQALDRLPGLVSQGKGEVALNPDHWMRDEPELTAELEKAFAAGKSDTTAFNAFEPSTESYSAWSPFLWEVQEREIQLAKIQLAGPLTSQWALRLTDGTPADRIPEIGMQIFRLVLARSIAMVRLLKARGATPLFYLDEPGLYGLNQENPRHIAGLQELKLFVQTLKKEGALVGLHCCSNTEWATMMTLGFDLISIDTKLSLLPLLRHGKELKAFLKGGGRLSLGVIPTGKGKEDVESFEPELAFEHLLNDLYDNGLGNQTDVKQLLENAVYTTACGLALHRIEDAEIVLSYNAEFCYFVKQYLNVN
jgi:hypothetical protein